MDSLNPLSPLARFYYWILQTPSLVQQPVSSLEFGAPVQIVEQFPNSEDCTTKLPQSYEGNLRLGFLYQELCRRLFDAHSDFRIMAEEVQLQQNGRTLGAIDFLLENSHNGIEHWEVAIKFYLLRDGIWFGPNSHDQLDIKLHHMLTHQLMMSECDSFRRQFPKVKQVSKHLLMQGRLYINPFRPETIPTHCLGYLITPSQINGFWCHYSDAHNIELPLYELAKKQWAVGDSPQIQQTLPPVSLHANRINHCQDAKGQFWFIVPDCWPNQNGSSLPSQG